MLMNCYCCGKPFRTRKMFDLYCEDCRERETAKDNEIFAKAEERDLINLACGIMDEARVDFDKVCKRWHKAVRSYELARTYQQIHDADRERKRAYDWVIYECRWWLSKNFKIWGGTLDGKKILTELINDSEILNNCQKWRLLEWLSNGNV